MNVETGVPALDTALVWGGAVSLVAGLLAVVWRAVRAALRLGRKLDHFMDDWAGEAARPGVPPRPGVVQRLTSLEERQSRVEHELYPNGGGSLRDAVDLANQRLAHLCADSDLSEGASLTQGGGPPGGLLTDRPCRF
ncbi:hypothetical protein ACFXHD_02465 [Streptomyces hydrogenans]|uniref:hypothetical protein n=1 Tax=Streptomyces hydrogenans TaxID=1873719 RepID=UPI00367F44E3